MEILEIDGEKGFIDRCFCGEEQAWCSITGIERGGCNGLGTLHCYCGGDLCVCHNHGEIECPGCEDCAAIDEDTEFFKSDDDDDL